MASNSLPSTKHLSISILLTSLIFSSLAFLPTPSLSQNTSTCVTQDKPSPLTAQYLAQYPDYSSGTINGTTSFLPVDYATARAIVPPQYEILRKPWAALFPEWEKQNVYPMLLQALHGHDLQYQNYTTPDFSRASLTFPFIDLLHDNYTSFRLTYGALLNFYDPTIITDLYGPPDPVVGYFDPPCDAYRFAIAAEQEDDEEHPILFDGYVNATQELVVETLLSPKPGDFDSVSTIPLSVFKNVTNQPLFQNGTICNNFIQFYNTSLTTDPPPQVVVGNVTLKPPFFPKETSWSAVGGLKAGFVYLSTNPVCTSLEGYSGL